jgi:hypothetical protein
MMVSPRTALYTCVLVRLGFRLADFDTSIHAPSRPFSLPLLPLNPNVLSIFEDQSRFVLNPWWVPYPREYGWNPANLLSVRDYVGPLAKSTIRVQAEPIRATAVLPPLPPHPDPFLWDWLWNMRCSRLREFCVHSRGHHRD